MALPHKLKNMNLFVNGDNYMGVIGEVELPVLALKLETWRGGGMLGEIDVNLGVEKLEVTNKFGGIVTRLLRQFGALGASSQMLRFLGAYQEDVEGGVLPAELVMTGMHTEITPGTAKPGDPPEWGVKSTLSYLRWTVAGRVETEINMLTGLLVTGGVDRTAALRAAIGL